MAAALQTPQKPLKVVIATRESRLALWQAEHVKALLKSRLGWQVELLGMTTLGDQILDRSLSKIGGKGLFVKELEVALAEGRADLAVHSLKDVPMDLPDGFTLACVLAREDPHDAFVSNHFASLAELPHGAVVGTSSLRRLVLLKSLRPDLVIQPLRGNLDTRLRKLDEGQYDGIVLAAAGLKRLKLESRIRHTFVPDDMLPAAGQGALGIEVRADRADLINALATLAHQPTWLAVTAERTVSRSMGGSCSMPLAAFVTAGSDGALRLDAAWGEPATADALSGSDQPAPAPLVHARQSAVVRTFAEAEALGEAVASQLRAGGAVWAGNTPLPA
ncbi:hydroxymethylbilane synthase [Polaromonas sp. CG_23.6]|uniref:hydroxymethylbilane synthase n=1 Tax=Polaromonas sp. CG_23.6 TaxID=2760709 RepID=UPI002473DBAC|nr:hydroxymethylbilane synthase [Polaromonas sp. CG_23.6]MDH6184156.1 hydroxymethylbilane synthase [Polaromonas sp. CG_23.6]